MPDVRIESILGGQSPLSNFASKDQFRSSLGIDPGGARKDSNTTKNMRGTGLLRPTPNKKVSGTTIGDAVMWIVPNPKDSSVYIYDHSGSVYTTLSTSPYTVTALSDAGEMVNSKGNGAAYYDNYIYFAKNTTIARYGPLDGTPAFNGNYWTTTLSKTALNLNDSYPTSGKIGYFYPNHILHRHSDGRLYISDVVDNRGSISFISTTKTTAEGDTDNGSTYNKLQFGYNFWPSAIESFGTNLVIALFEGGTQNNYSKSRAKLVIWDTVSQNYNSISNDEFPDQFISALLNINGILYIISGDYHSYGFRVSRYIGGNSIEEVAYFEDGEPPFAGSVTNNSGSLSFGSFCIEPEAAGCIYSIGIRKPSVTSGLFCTKRSTGDSTAIITAISAANAVNNKINFIWSGWSNGSVGGTNNGLDVPTTNSPDYSLTPQVFWSQVFRVGRPGKITKITIPLAQPLTANMTVTPTIYNDDAAGSRTLTAITSAAYGVNTQLITIRPQNVSFDFNFFLELRWTGSDLCVVSLPIIIEYELINIDTAYP